MIKKVNLSRIPRLPERTLVKAPGYKQVGILESNIDPAKKGDPPLVEVKFPGGKLVRFKEDEIRTLTFREFLWYRDPNTGWPKIGKNGAIPLLIANIAALGFIIGSFTIEGPEKIIPIVISVGVIAVTYFGTKMNYLGKWV